MSALWTASEVAHACAGTLIGPDVALGGFSTDSRTVKTGDLFVALRGDRFDAHDFIADVQTAGAAAVVIANDCPHEGGSLIRVSDTRLALGDIARAWRSRFTLPLIGVTGSNGKTTVKEMIAAILRAHALSVGWPTGSVLATRGNLNNDIGVPLMLFGLRDTHRLAVIEMGMNHPGEIAWLAGIAKPTVALVNNAQREHLEFMNSVAEVASENGDVFDALGADGVAVINADDEFADYWAGRNADRRMLRFGLSPDADADVGATATPTGLGYRLDLHGVFGTAQIMLRVPGLHNARNALCAATASLAAGADMAAVVWALNHFEGVKGRQQVRRGAAGSTVIDDSYNANPDSVRAAIDVLAAANGRRVLVLGDMGEVGNQGPAFHREAGAYARERGIHALHALGEASVDAVTAFGPGALHYTDHAAIAAALHPQLDATTTVLVKGSRFMRMERIAEALVAPSGQDSHAA
ncbi:UDP-N-acetylmuramoyl-tripeptide--D-alanyl-D-alanine ligase [Methyloversatilis sp. XJ19-13]|uniref:UDP-N-acetylmuramoyl-tripeptide--D-alanyl-D- alanine ligase n=1 Tax=Methyloversatilis sp. XJ19-13 TaxID=2963430 RepID=UPI00211C948A|nr:UDP-N-acetylmuramoyl-tripeptide--D-alanyl-D-alanine ligase [Methyloversatilis sp. XJ19-13]MCQ9373073.1 UDP-N-acetylmuramoyl-tripeptide--D-alanyl-D-alanine ligase [Methyloversatilis sp. XJ19-13]